MQQANNMPRETTHVDIAWHERLRTRALWVALALVLSLIAWWQAADNTYRAPGVLAWVGSMACWLAAWWDTPRPRLFARGRAGVHVYVLAATGVLLVAALFRFYDLPNLPPEMTSDHAEKLLDVRDVLNGMRPIFFPRNTGREPAQFYVTALLAGPLGLGLSYMALKVGTALVSWLTVALTMWAVRWGLGGSRRLALLTGLLLAISKWHIAISRVGLRFPYTPLATALVLGFLWRAVRFNHTRDWVLTGLALGLGLHGYTATRIVPLLVAVAFAVAFLWARPPRTAWPDWFLRAALAPLSTVIAFVPLLRFSLEHPDLFWYRSASRMASGIAEPGVNVFLLNLKNAALAFHLHGDSAWPNAVLGDPFLDRITGVLFVIGIALVLVNLIQRPRIEWAVALLGLPILILPSVLALAWPNENPSVVRMGGALPIVMLLSALPLDTLLQRANRHARHWHLLALAGTTILILWAAVLNWQTYFVTYRAQYAQSSWNSSEIAQEILTVASYVGGVEHVYIFSYPHWVDTRNVAFNMKNPDWNRVLFTIADIENAPDEVRAIIFNPNDRVHILSVETLWNNDVCRYTVASRTPGKEFVVMVRGEAGRRVCAEHAPTVSR
ncbi:hypothetical protein ARMA_1967 [Ardenticatena maritima]|uniref:Glycosyltransferase RgtA/B/C/D-like domain-containing protein n=1 Tax=Ardenticatena maritima TaxID=872965 RepID=A0A0M9UD14_9CHLR|nr:hypothetical protein [Ardenticatena maritima]KPL89067.1 hypothetical protein SE16_00490 [Ardenticatena maritima]GAP63544.1 hypothetical protein ARMA_1967 [Ardenticatena maritima]